MKLLIIIMLTAMMAASPLVLSSVSATHMSETTTWQLVYLTDTNRCSNYDHQMTTKYEIITEKYFGEYEFDNKKYEPLCMNHYQYDAIYEAPDDLDLLILVYSRNLGESELHSDKMGGLFTHSGPNRDFNNAIIICDCSNFYYSDPVWILTHELSHFVLYFLEYDMYVIEDMVHQYDEKYDLCRTGSYDESCKDILLKLRVEPMAYSFSVMPPYSDAIGQSKLKNNDVNVSESVVELGKVVTKWWTQGKITEGDYSNALGLLAVQSKEIESEDYNVMFKDGPISDEVTWEEVLLADGSDKNKQSVMSKVREKLKTEEQPYLQTDYEGLPPWFENNAKWWVEEKITDEDFIRSVKFLQDSGIIRDHQLDK